MKKTVMMLVCAVMLTGYAYAQEQLSVRQQANKLYERYQYFKALNLYLKAPEKAQADVFDNRKDSRLLPQYSAI